MKILIPVDGSPYSAAALEFIAARPFRDEGHPHIDLLNVQLPVPPRAGRAVGSEFVRAWHEAESRKILKPAIATLQQAGLQPAWFYRVGSPDLVIAEWAEQHAVDLIVMGSHGHSAVKGMLFGSVTQRVLACTTVPVIALRTASAPQRSSLRVGIALDGSGYGVAAANYAIEHRELFGPRPMFTLIHAVMLDMRAMAKHAKGLLSLPTADLVQAETAAFDRVLTPVAKQFAQAGLTADEHRAVGPPAEEVARFAKTARLDLLIMGSHGRGALTAAVLGSVAWRVAASCTTPLLIIRRPARVQCTA
jgi:nucleotide-binding universal stress UspA family protein